MNAKTLVISVILVSLMAFGAVPMVFAVAKTPDLQMHVFLHPDPQNQALEDGTLDINDWPLTKEWIDKWALMPDDITLRGYVEMGMMEIDMNHQMWPTGSGTKPTKYYDAADTQCLQSANFRKAVACLVDRDTIVRDVLKGYGYRMDLPLPPFQSAYMDMANYTAEGLIYDYNKTRAIEFLTAGGFVDTDFDTIRNDPSTGNNLEPLTFYIRMDDPNRRRAGEMLATELASVGVPTNAIITEKTVCYKNVMVLYNYHLYTGGWSLGTIPDQYYDLFSTAGYFGPVVGWSLNYAGMCNYEFDAWAEQVKYPASVDDAIAAAKTCGYLFLKYCEIVPLYASKAVKAYRKGWTGVVNNAGYGIDNYWTFLNMYESGNTVIDYGMKSDIEQLNVISSEWLWDWNVLGLIYDSLLGNNPFNLAPSEKTIASGYTTSTWDASSGGGDSEATVIDYTLRDNIYWHNASGGIRRNLNASDIEFTFDYTYGCGPGIAWNYLQVEEFNRTEIIGEYEIKIYYNRQSAWAVQWAGGLPIINPDIWNLVSPSEARNYDPAAEDRNGNGIMDLIEDGCGPWIYDDYVMGSYVKLVGDDQYYLDQTFIDDSLETMFHDGAGDVDGSGVVNVKDLGFMARSLGTNTGSTHGEGWEQYNVACDFNGDGVIDALDLAVVAGNYGATMG